MEFKEVTMVAYPNTRFIPFGISRAPEDDIFLAINRNTIQVLELNYRHHYNGTCRMLQSVAYAPKYIPSQHLNIDSKRIYQKASHKDRQYILQDLHLLSKELKVGDPHIVFVSAKWSTRILNRPNHFLALLTKFGGCEIVAQPNTKRKWTRVICDVSALWKEHCDPDNQLINELGDLKQRAMDVYITAISWNTMQTSNDERQWFVTINARGMLAFYCLENIPVDIFSDVIECNDMTTTIKYTKDLNYSKIKLLEWFTFYDRSGMIQSFLLAGDKTGDVRLLKVEFSKSSHEVINVAEVTVLFSEGDGVVANGFQWDYKTTINAIKIIFCKGMHLFVYLISLNGRILSQKTHYVGHLYISGIHKLSPCEYLVGSASGLVQSIYVEADPKGLNISSKIHKTTINVSKYAIYGLVCSTNNAFLLTALYVRQPFDHLILREPATISVTQFIGDQVLTKLEENPAKMISNVLDYAELLRCLQLKNDTIFLKYLQTLPPSIQCTDEYLYAMRVRLVATSARSTYLRERYRLYEANSTLDEYNILKKFTYAILACRKLQYLNQIGNNLTTFQLTSARCQRNLLKNFIAADIAEAYDALKKEFHPIVEVLLIETEHFDELSTENCAYCNDTIGIGEQICANGHDLPRCCLSMVQVQMLSERYCANCEVIAIEDSSYLQQIMEPRQQNKQIVCPLCDREFEIFKFGFSDYNVNS